MSGGGGVAASRSQKAVEEQDPFSDEAQREMQKRQELDDELAALDAIMLDEQAQDQRNNNSTTTVLVVAAAAPPLASKKRTASEANERPQILLPPRMQGTVGARRIEGQLMRWTYDCSTLIQTITNLTRFFEFCPLTFDATGLVLSALEVNSVMKIYMHVPRAAFVEYDDVAATEPVSVTLASKSLKALTRSCTDRRTISFLYDRSGDPDAELHIQLYPRLAQYKDESSTVASFKQSNVDAEEVAFEPVYQYRVFMTRQEFVEKVRDVATDAGSISILIGDKCFEFASISKVGTNTLIHSLNAIETLESVAGDAEKEQVEAGIRGALARGMCVVQRSATADPKINISHMRGFRIGCKYIRSAALVAAQSACSRISIDMGVRPLDDAPSEYREMPICLTYYMRLGEPGEFIVKTWIAPRYPDEE